MERRKEGINWMQVKLQPVFVVCGRSSNKWIREQELMKKLIDAQQEWAAYPVDTIRPNGLMSC